MRLLFALAIVLGSALPAFAGATAWVEVAPGARVRLIANDQRAADGRTLVGIEAELPAGSTTYWRVPGESGIPTEVEFAGSTGIRNARLHWPFPTIETVSGLTDFVYSGHLVLPVALEADARDAVVRAQVSMGICSDICVPASAAFTLPLDFAHPDAAQAIRLAQAVATTPIAWDGPPEAISELSYDAAAGGLRLKLTDPSIEPGSVLAELPGDAPLVGAPQKSPDSGSIILPLLGSTREKGLEGKPVQLTFMTTRGPYEAVRRVVSEE